MWEGNISARCGGMQQWKASLSSCTELSGRSLCRLALTTLVLGSLCRGSGLFQREAVLFGSSPLGVCWCKAGWEFAHFYHFILEHFLSDWFLSCCTKWSNLPPSAFGCLSLIWPVPVSWDGRNSVELLTGRSEPLTATFPDNEWKLLEISLTACLSSWKLLKKT